MYDRIKYLYDKGRLTSNGVQNAVSKGWITQEQHDQIVSA